MPSDSPYSADLPLTEVTYFLLLSLASSPRHGYALMKDVRLLSQDRLRLSTGTLYGALKRLLDMGWILRIDEADSQAARPRKAYQLTGLGRSILSAEVKRLEGLVSAARVRAAGTARMPEGSV